MSSEIRPTGTLRVSRIPLLKRPPVRDLNDALTYGARGSLLTRLGRYQRRNRPNFGRSIADQRQFDHGGVQSNRLGAIGHLWLAKVSLDGTVTDYGLVSCRVVTTAGVNYIVDSFQNLTEPENMKFHGVGTGSAAEAIGNTALTTELTTQYSTANTRPTGTLGEQSGNANVYETTATVTVSAAVAITEHGIFSQAATGGGVLLDRSVFAAVNLASGESLQCTYSLSFPAGG